MGLRLRYLVILTLTWDVRMLSCINMLILAGQVGMSTKKRKVKLPFCVFRPEWSIWRDHWLVRLSLISVMLLWAHLTSRSLLGHWIWYWIPLLALNWTRDSLTSSDYVRRFLHDRTTISLIHRGRWYLTISANLLSLHILNVSDPSRQNRKPGCITASPSINHLACQRRG